MGADLVRYRLRHRARPLDVWVVGEGRPLALLHGWGLHGRAYRGAALALAERGYRVVAPSLTVAEEWSIEAVADAAAEALAGVDAAPAAVVGHSFGGVIGSQLAHDHRDFVTALVAVNSPLVGLGSLRLGRIVLPGQHYRIATHLPAAAALVKAASSSGGMRSLVASARWFVKNGHERTLVELSRRGLPVAVVWAANDTLLPAAIGARAAEHLGCELHLVRADEHWPGKRPPDHDWPFRHPRHFARRIADTLAHLEQDHGRDAQGAPA